MTRRLDSFYWVAMIRDPSEWHSMQIFGSTAFTLATTTDRSPGAEVAQVRDSLLGHTPFLQQINRLMGSTFAKSL